MGKKKLENPKSKLDRFFFGRLAREQRYRRSFRFFFSDVLQESKDTEDLFALLPLLEKMAALGHPACVSKLAVRYFHGKGVPQDLSIAAKYLLILSKVVPEGDPTPEYAQAFYLLGVMYLTGALRFGDPQIHPPTPTLGAGPIDSKSKIEGIIALERATGTGHPGAAKALGDIYSQGVLVPKSIEDAMACYKIAAHTNAEAMFHFGTLGLTHYPNEDPSEFIQFIEKSANAGEPRAKFWLAKNLLKGGCLQTNERQAAELLAESLELNPQDPDAAFELSLMTIDGRGGVQKDFQKASRLMLLAASREHPQAYFLLGSWYFEGKIVKRNLKLAVHFWTKALEVHNVEAAASLAKLYWEGTKPVADPENPEVTQPAIEKDSSLSMKIAREALRWSEKKSPACSESGLLLLAKFLIKRIWYENELLSGSEIRSTVAILRRLCDAGNKESLYYLGMTALDEEQRFPGIEDISPQAAIRMVIEAMEHGSTEAAVAVLSWNENNPHFEIPEYLAEKSRELLYRSASEGNAMMYRIVVSGLIGSHGTLFPTDFQKAAEISLEFLEHQVEEGESEEGAIAGAITNLLNILYHSPNVLLDRIKQEVFSLADRYIHIPEIKYKYFRYFIAHGTPEEQRLIYTWSIREKTDDDRLLFLLGAMYHTGIGTHPDIEEAVKYYELAAQKGNSSAMANLGRLYAERARYAESFQWRKMAVAKGDTATLYELALHYYAGQGTKRDIPEAMRLLTMAARNGHPDAKKMLALLQQIFFFSHFRFLTLSSNL
eukprot:TRINITY_DN2130_c0_g1_i3.p1 TRINITY_DN2130_c0_g1~~TRINITY_DN2130_c0_g1_i3.p1  ORF type:complete len:773 (+),score=136.09 TRINITY_DN2130_c0_g1_i3:692-3010(+)